MIIDTDGGIDDASAIWWALESPEVEVVGITTVHGNIDAVTAAANVCRILEAAGRVEIPVAVGADVPFAEAPEMRPADFIHGTDGIGDTGRPAAGHGPVDATADELLTLLGAGHETTASTLAWTFERLVRLPKVLARLTDEIADSDGDAYITATTQEALRRRPVLPNAAPRLVKQPVEVGGWSYPTDVCLVPNAYLVHHDPEIYSDPYAFRPERFLDEPPGTYTWIPFGGGRRRCIGASFAMLEMKIVIRSILEAQAVAPVAPRPEHARRRNITITPEAGSLVTLSAPQRELIPTV